MNRLVERLAQEHRLDADGYYSLISSCDGEILDRLRKEAVRLSTKVFGHGVFVRGLIEISNYCRNDCLYCGLRCSNKDAVRYRLSDDEILDCCATGYSMGLRTFVLQGGEDSAFTDSRLVPLISEMRARWKDAAITLSLGERAKVSYLTLFNAGVSRYLLRHEAADSVLYSRLHPSQMSLENRINCIRNLMDIGYQTGMGMMIGVPGQTVESVVEDLLLMERLRPQMIGIGPFIPHCHTPFSDNPPGNMRQVLLVLAIVRIMFPFALIPATTALSTLSPDGRKSGILSGANVVMPNLSPAIVREKYAIYDNKLSSGKEGVEGLVDLENELNSIGYHVDYSRGDYKKRNI